MRERHPIDERFRRALYNGEADPPEAVRSALGAQLGWTAAPRAGGSWWPVVIVVVGLIGTGAALWAWQDDPGPMTVTRERVVSEQHPAKTVTPTTETTAVVPSTTTDPTTPADPGPGLTMSTTSVSIGQRKAATESGSEGSLSASNEARTNATAGSTANTARAARTKATSDRSEGNTPDARTNTGKAGTAMSGGKTPTVVKGQGNETAASTARSAIAAQEPTPNGPEPFARVKVSDPSTSGQDLRSRWMDPLRIAPNPMVPGGTPVNTALLPSYVLPSGTWWIGPYVGIGTVQGSWKGPDADALQKAEQWQSTMQGGLLVGREWRSGWGVSAGLGVARVRSTFHHDDATQASTVLEIDTTWAETMHTSGDILYSWQIDSLTEQIPGGLVRKDARNLYTAIQVPLLLHWHADARRLRYGAFGGFNAWIPTQRNGLTLVNSQQDAQPTTLALQDPKVDDRFSTQVHGLIGLSLGYTITEQFSAYAEPMISVPLLSFDGSNTPWLTRPLLQFRIQYDLRSKGR